ncbi:MAG TPA: DUF1570 domain-containing protein [Pirellulaceae bacterium]|nr:DUF1570 domain-containing protein [Pirellulaceae bacterium]
MVHLDEWIATAILVAQAPSSGLEMTAQLRTPGLPELATRYALSRAIAVLVFCATCQSLPAAPLQPDRAAIDATFKQQLGALATKCDELGLVEQSRQSRQWIVPRGLGRQVLFVAADTSLPVSTDGEKPVVVKWREHFIQCRQDQAARLFELAQQRLAAGHAASAYQLVHEVLHEDPDHKQARAILGYRKSGDTWIRPGGAIRRRSGRATHPKFGWRRATYWQVESPHFRITTNHSPEMGIELAERLERFQSLWRQLFFSNWSTHTALLDRFAGGNSSLGTSKKHEIVLFKDRQEYVSKLVSVGPQIKVSLGYYAKDQRTSLFYAGDNRSEPTWFHETTHQLFQEAGNAVHNVGEKWNFWIVEGIAVYMESLVQHDGYYSLGGFDADRLQYDRWRTLRGEPCLPLSEMVELGRENLQRHRDIRRIYTRAAALAHFLMDAEDGANRDALMRLIDSVYLGRDSTQTLATSTGIAYDELEKRLPAFLAVSDSDLKHLNPPDRVHNLSLGLTRVSDEGLLALADCKRLHWLDLAFTKVTDVGAQQLKNMPLMKRLSLEGTKITNASLPVVGRMTQLQELDLAHTTVTDVGITQLGRLTDLTTLYLTKTPITDASIPTLAKLTKLRILDVEGTGITPDGLAQLRKTIPGLRNE